MILIDDRVGSNDLLDPLRREGLSCDLAHLDFGDVSFIGRGLNGADVYIGIELKETRDLVSCVRSSRFSGHQLAGLQQYDRAWLLTEGIWRAGEEGVLEEMRGGWRPTKPRIMAADLESWLLSQTIRGGISYRHCNTRRDTIRFLSVMYRWWTSKDLDEHRSHQAIYLPPPDRAMLVEPSAFLKMASCLPGVGWDKAMKLEEACGGSMRALVSMSASELREIPSIGPKIAQRILDALGSPQ